MSGSLETTSLQEVNKNIQVTTVNLVKEGAQEQAKVNNIARQVVQKNTKKPYVPMRFRSKAPDSFTAGTTSQTKKESFDVHTPAVDKESTPVGQGVVPTLKSDTGAVQQTNGMRAQKSTKITKRNSISQKNMQALGANDSELQVHYYHTLSRKGPLSDKHRDWLQKQEVGRQERDLAYNKKLRKLASAGVEEVVPVVVNKTIGKKKNAPHPVPTPREDDDDDDSAMPSPPRPFVQPKYESAQAFMDTHFPVFDKPDYEDAHGLLR